MRAANGEVATWICTAIDIQDQRQRELSLRALEHDAIETLTVLQQLQSAAPWGFSFVDRDFRILRINESLARAAGVSLEAQLGRTVAEVLPGLWGLIEDAYRRALAGEAVVNLEVSGPSAADSGRTHHWLTSYHPVRVEGEIIGVGNLVIDITEGKEDEELRAAVMDNMAEGLFTLDGDGLVKYMSDAASKMVGWAEDELRVADDTFTRKDGTTVFVAYCSAPLRVGSAVRGAVVVFRDITDELGDTASAMREPAKLSWVGRIRDAIAEGRLVLYSQPIVSLGDGEPSEELLLRMIGPSGNVILPGSVLPRNTGSCHPPDPARGARRLRTRISPRPSLFDCVPPRTGPNGVPGVSIDTTTREVVVAGGLVEFTRREVDLLAQLAATPRHVFSREQPLRSVWQSSSDWQTSRTVIEHIRRIRHKIEPDPAAAAPDPDCRRCRLPVRVLNNCGALRHAPERPSGPAPSHDQPG